MVSHIYHTLHVKHWILNVCMCKSFGIITHQPETKGHNNPISLINPLQYQYTQSSFLLPSAVVLHNTQLSYLYFLLWSWTQPRQVFAIIFFFTLFIPLCYYTKANTLPIEQTWYFESYTFQLLQTSHYQCVQKDVGNGT